MGEHAKARRKEHVPAYLVIKLRTGKENDLIGHCATHISYDWRSNSWNILNTLITIDVYLFAYSRC